VRLTVGLLLAHAALLVAGYGVLAACGQLRPLSPVRILAAAGLAYMAGVATVMSVLILLLIAGVGLTLPVFAVACVVVALPALAVAVRPSSWSPLPRRRLPTIADVRAVGIERWGVAALVLLLAWIGITGASAARFEPLNEFDNFLIWTNKAVVLFHYGNFPHLFLSTKIESGGHWDYPILLPVLEAMQFRAAGSAAPEAAHVVPWLLFGGFVWAAAFLVRRSTRPAVWAGVLGGIVLLEIPQVTTGLADTPVACFLALGTLAVGQWIQERRTSDLAIGAVMLVGSAATKTEGVFGAFIVVAVALVVLAVARDWRAAKRVAIAGAAVALVAIVPWQIWVAAHDIPPTTPLSDALNPAYLVDHADRVWPSITAIYSVIAGLNFAQFAVPVAIALFIVRVRAFPRVSAFYLAVGLLYFGALVWAYWVTPLDLTFLIGTSASRIHVGVVLLAAVAILHLGGELVPWGEDPAEPATVPGREADAPIAEPAARELGPVR
jgi:hypothetical protein